MKHVEMIIDYTTDGTDYQYNDNHGLLIRCRDCVWYDDKGHCDYYENKFLNDVKEDDYCSRGENVETYRVNH